MIDLYNELMEKHGPQGWWPLKGIGYHKEDYSYPKDKQQRFEIICGAILTQNTSWRQVEKALDNLSSKGRITPDLIKENKIEELIRPAGYYNQKADRLRRMADYFLEQKHKPTRQELLKIKGIGPETADSILLYAYKVPSFVIDKYTERVLLKRGIIKEKKSYNELKELFEKNLPKDFKIYQDFHALLVEEAKNLK
ncbi:MAG: endonuclease III domain-containing protein [Nanobdellota archaeon]